MFVLLLMATMSCSGQVLGKGSECGKQRGVSAKPLDEVTWAKMNDAYEDVGNELYDEAYRKLQIISNRAHDDYLRTVVFQELAQVEWARSNYESALAYFEKAVDLDALPDPPHFSLMYQTAQLYNMKERYDEALDKLELWMCKVAPEKITADAWVLKASIYAQKEDWKNIITSIDTAISMSGDPKQGWYQLKLISHYELEQFPKVAQTLEVMIQKWPDKKDYWTQLSQIYFRLKRNDEALAVMALAYRRNMLDTQADIKYLSNLYSDRDVPFKAAKVLQKGIEDGIVEDTSKNWAVIADTWYAAAELEKALVAYENAGKASVDGEIDLRRAYILVDMERWEDAAKALELALSKGGVNDNKTGQAYVLQGMSEFNLGNYDKASTAWGRASKYPKAKKSAEQWMNHMREERARKSS